MQIKNVTICGSGVLGGQIAFQTAFHQFNVVIYDISEAVLEKAKTKWQALGEAFKKDFYTQLGKVAPAKSIFCTNSSTLLPSLMAEETGRPERFLALHFANYIWKRNTAEIMGHAGTDPHVFDTVVAFAKAIGMVTIPIHKEQPGYILNSLLVPFVKNALSLYVNGIAAPETIDKTWMKATGAPRGPFGICDVVGIITLYHITKMAANAGDVQAQKTVKVLQENFIDKGKLGVSTGEGFYTYPNPAYESTDFLKQ